MVAAAAVGVGRERDDQKQSGVGWSHNESSGLDSRRALATRGGGVVCRTNHVSPSEERNPHVPKEEKPSVRRADLK